MKALNQRKIKMGKSSFDFCSRSLEFFIDFFSFYISSDVIIVASIEQSCIQAAEWWRVIRAKFWSGTNSIFLDSLLSFQKRWTDWTLAIKFPHFSAWMWDVVVLSSNHIHFISWYIRSHSVLHNFLHSFIYALSND